jgi:hypothetical protein
MNGKVIAGLAGALLALFTCCIAGLGLAGGGIAVAACAAPITATDPARSLGTPASRWPTAGNWTSAQTTNAATIVAVGQRLHIPARGWVTAVPTATQESTLTNLGHLSPRTHLLQVPHRQDPLLADITQAVQRSAHPATYARHEPEASAVIAKVDSNASPATSIDLEQCPRSCPILSSGGTSGPIGRCLGGDAVLARAATWLTAWGGGPVPYLSNGDQATWFGGYRRDCSGYASMALGLAGPGPDGVTLAEQSTSISQAELRAGDLLINPAPGAAGHVVIFDHWADAAMASYVGYEQSGDGGTHHRRIPYPYFGGYPMSPYRHTTAMTAGG